MEKTKRTGKTLFRPYGTISALLGHFLEKRRSGKQVSPKQFQCVNVAKRI